MHCSIGYLPSLVKKKKIYGSKEFIVGKKEVRNTVGNREFSENGKKHITNLLNCVGA